MRLINADDLIKAFLNHCCTEFEIKYKCRSDENVLALIVNAPTVEERPKGKWIQLHEGLSLYYHICSNCRTTPLELEEYEVLSDFCPHCGADMRGNDNEDTN